MKIIPQIVSRNMTNLTPAQLEQFESTFRYFDKDESQTLSITEMTAALASLGIVYSDEDMDFIYAQLTEDYSAVTFEAFINLLVIYFIPLTAPIVNIDLDRLRRSISQKTRHRPSSCGSPFAGLLPTRCVAARKILLVLTVRMRSRSLPSWTCGLHISHNQPSITCGRLCRGLQMKRASLSMTMSDGWMMFSRSRVRLNGFTDTYERKLRKDPRRCRHAIAGQ
jgi:hypothetical protein